MAETKRKEKMKKLTEAEIKVEKERAYREKLKLASYCPKVSGQAWSHIGRDK